MDMAPFGCESIRKSCRCLWCSADRRSAGAAGSRFATDDIDSGYTGEEWYEELIRHRISQTIYTYEMAEKLNDTAAKMGKTTPIHIKLDTGMGRIGFRTDETSISTVKKICEMPFLEPKAFLLILQEQTRRR